MARKKKVSPGNRLVAYYRYSGGSQQTEQSIEGRAGTAKPTPGSMA